MSDDLLQQLQFLEEDYLEQPPAAQRTDLQEINRLRGQLGMPLVDSRLNEIGAAVIAVEENAKPESEPEPLPDHSEAREIYQDYLKKSEVLTIHQDYADRVARATSGPGQTPVEPLATMGTNGGPLLCDHCEKPIVLEGGKFHGVTADVAWQKHPRDKWRSWILGGMVVEIQTNGTLRIYHGYPGRNNNHCCNIASRQDEEARKNFDSSQRTEKIPLLTAFIEHEFPKMTCEEQMDLLNEILNTMFTYDPGLGINRPDLED